MSDEIKEILDRLKRIEHKTYSCAFEFADSASFQEMCRCFEERKKLAACITNLQQELERYKHYSKTTGIEELMQENEYLKKHQRFHKKFGNDYIFCVEGDKETYKDLLLEKQEELEDYKSRFEKAIEYNQKIYDTTEGNEKLLSKINLEILQGGKDDNN